MKMVWPSPERNKDPILKIIQEVVAGSGGQALEISSGSGQHAAYFAEMLPNWTWQPSDIEKIS